MNITMMAQKMSEPEIVESYTDWLRCLRRRYKESEITFRLTGDYEYSLLFITKTNNLMVGMYDFKKDKGKVFDRRAKQRE